MMHERKTGGLLALDTPRNRSRSDPGRAPGAASQGLACEEPQATGDPKRYWFFYDGEPLTRRPAAGRVAKPRTLRVARRVKGHGNVGQVLRYAAGATPTITRVAHYEYDPYG